jgi:hypothetical protein
MARSRSPVKRASEINISREDYQRSPEIRIALALESIAQSLRDQVNLQKEAAIKGRKGQPKIVRISQASYNREGQGQGQSEILPGPEAGAEVPGFRRR